MDSTSASLLHRLNDSVDQEDSVKQEAWDMFVEIYTPMVLFWVKSHGVSRTDSEDVTQEIMIRLHRLVANGFSYDPSKSFRGLLKTISRQVAINQYRKNQRHDYAQLFETEIPPEIDVFEAENYKICVVRGVLPQVQAMLPESYEPFRLRYLDGLSVAEVSETLGMSSNAVCVACHRVVSRLRKLLQGLVDQ